ncbi:unnamed protein product [Brachionus calyciflorus]|uniref:Uncharacterized protein n=1 Tax=Brachionus calyciflorus TaxID=104777 RepID=A0A813PU73_9BILA|nr:unnamed protein product [Brachionus calyciflorus]
MLLELYDRILSGEPRTNNHVEAWHRNFKHNIVKYPSVPSLLEHLLLEKNTVEYVYEQLKSGEYYELKKVEQNKNKKLLNCVNTYNKNKIIEYLTSIKNNLLD